MVDFYKMEQRVREKKFPVQMSKSEWEDVENILTPYVIEEGDFDNVHLCWRAALYSLIKKIGDSRNNKGKNPKINLVATEFYAVKEILDNTIVPADPNDIIPGLLALAEQIKRA